MGDFHGVDDQWSPSTLLGGLRPTDRAALLAVGTRVEYASERRLIEQGAADDHAYLLLAGMVKVSIRDDNGHTALLGIRIAGDMVGEMGSLEGSPRSADVIACGAVEARVMGAAELRSLTRRHPDIALGLAMMIGRRLRWANRRRLDFSSRDSRTRVARVLYELVRGYGTKKPTHWEIGVPLTQPEIASLAGVGLRTVEKELRSLESEGVLIRKYRRIDVGDLAGLLRIANG
ncbi:MAG: Crp/Fnr family transcriptional regulator [Actinophytocola sp.]|uniref:Crp/Fnr family transcriptional regulator n=1 Tax=Actinophytocola sp. TaxID=1872138 RepID=UPI003C76167E